MQPFLIFLFEFTHRVNEIFFNSSLHEARISIAPYALLITLLAVRINANKFWLILLCLLPPIAELALVARTGLTGSYYYVALISDNSKVLFWSRLVLLAALSAWIVPAIFSSTTNRVGTLPSICLACAFIAGAVVTDLPFAVLSTAQGTYWWDIYNSSPLAILAASLGRLLAYFAVLLILPALALWQMPALLRWRKLSLPILLMITLVVGESWRLFIYVRTI